MSVADVTARTLDLRQTSQKLQQERRRKSLFGTAHIPGKQKGKQKAKQATEFITVSFNLEARALVSIVHNVFCS